MFGSRYGPRRSLIGLRGKEPFCEHINTITDYSLLWVIGLKEYYEHSGDKYQKSLCHAWGASPIYLIGKYFLGVSATSIADQTFSPRPNLGKFRWLKGKVPVQNGYVSVELSKEKLRVCSGVPGGTLERENGRYELLPGKAVEIVLKPEKSG